MPGNPYRGVECFGRERAASRLLALVDEHPLVALIGVAGSGKSSLVRGLPDARVIVPGEPIPMPRGGRMLLVVDQFERLLPADPAIDRLLELAGRQVRVVIAVRAESYADVLAHPGLAAALEPMTLAPMTRRELLHAIEEPARRAGCAFEPGLAERIADDAGADLRPMASALDALWERDAASGTLTAAGYHRLAPEASPAALPPAATPPAATPPAATPPARPRRRWAPVLAAALVVAVVAALFSGRRSDDTAASRAIAAAALPALDRRFDTGLLLALEAWRTADTPEARGAALTALQRTDRVRALLRNRSGGEVTAVARSGDTLAVADGTAVTLFDQRRRLPERLVSPDGTEPTAVAVSARGDLVAAAFGGDVVLLGGRRQTRLDARVTALAFSPDGRLLAGAGPRQLRVWDAGGRELHAQTLGRAQAGVAADVRFAPSEGALAEIRGGVLTFWRTDRWAPTRTLQVPRGLADAATLSPDLRHAAGAAGGLRLWQIGARDSTTLDGPEATGPAAAAAFSPDSRHLAVPAPDGTISVWDLATGRIAGHPLTGGRDALTVAWDRTMLVSGGRAGLTTLWNPPQPDAPGESGEHVAYGSAGALAWSDGTMLSLQPRPGVQPQERLVYSHAMEFAADGRTVVTAEPTRVRVFDLALQARATHIPDASVTAIATARRDLIAYGDEAGQVHLWPVGTFGEVRSSRRLWSTAGWLQPVGAVAIAPDGSVVAGAISNSVRLYSADVARLRDGPVLTGHDGLVTGVAFSPDGRIVASSSEDATVRLWSRRTGAAIGTLWAETKLAAVTFSPDGRTLAAAEAGGAIRLWDVATRRQLGAPLPAARPTDLAFAPDNRTLVAGGTPLERWSGLLWAATPDAIAGRICAIVARSLSRAEWRGAVADRSWHATCQ